MPPLTRQEFIENILEPLNQQNGWSFHYTRDEHTFNIDVHLHGKKVGSIAKDAIEAQNVRGITMALNKWWKDYGKTLHAV